MITRPSNNEEQACSIIGRSAEHLKMATKYQRESAWIHFFPNVIVVLKPDNEVIGGSSDNVVLSSSFNEAYKNRNAVKVDLDNSFIGAQLSENPIRPTPVRIWLPHVRGIEFFLGPFPAACGVMRPDE